MVNRSPESKAMSVSKGSGFMQGIILPFGITLDDKADGIRDGGEGSTDKKKKVSNNGDWSQLQLTK